MAWDKEPVSVLMFDLDHFKKINDRFGHAVGDRALQTFARTAAAKLRATDIVGRLGGEEFAAILPATNLKAAAVAAERVREAFEVAAKEIDGLPVGGTVSIGAAATDNPDSDMDTLLVLADHALYAAKASGRNRFVLSGSPEERAVASKEPQSAPSGAGGRGTATIAPNELSTAISAARATLQPAA
jgi:diguanylate cyclase (GGDEF)-like protein